MKDKIEEVANLIETGDRAHKIWKAKQICQLFPQPLDDKELREKIELILCHSITDTGLCSEYQRKICAERKTLGRCSWCLEHSAKAFALLQPKIEEAKRGVIKDLQFIRNACISTTQFDRRISDLIEALKGGE